MKRKLIFDNFTCIVLNISVEVMVTVHMDVGDATSTTSMDVVKVGLENQVGLE